MGLKQAGRGQIVFNRNRNTKRIVESALSLACVIGATIMSIDSFYNKIHQGNLALHGLSAIISILAITWAIDAKIDFVINCYDTDNVWIVFMTLSLVALSFDLAKLMAKPIMKIAKKVSCVSFVKLVKTKRPSALNKSVVFKYLKMLKY